MKRLKNGDKCKNEIKSAKSYRDEISAIVDELVASCLVNYILIKLDYRSHR